MTPDVADAYLDVLALAGTALSGDTVARTAILSAWEGRDGTLLLGAAIGRLAGLVAEHGDAAEWIAAEREATLRCSCP